jgi:hypothetical protein
VRTRLETIGTWTENKEAVKAVRMGPGQAG